MKKWYFRWFSFRTMNGGRERVNAERATVERQAKQANKQSKYTFHWAERDEGEK